MKKLIENLIRERKITIFLAIVLAIWGVFSYIYIPRQENPDVSAPVAMVITPYPGASAEDIDNLVSSKIEEDILEIDGIDYTKGISNDSVSIVVASFDAAVDTEKAMQDVRNAVADSRSELPSGVLDSMINTDLTETAGILISLSGEKYSYERLASFGEQFKNELSDVDGISKFNIEGKLDKEIRIDIDINRLNEIDISLEELNKILMAQNIEIPAGNININNNKVNVKVPGIFESKKDIENIIIGVSQKTSNVSRLKDVADIYFDVEEGAEKYKQNGQNAVLLTGYFKQSKNIVLIGNEVREKIESVKAKLPEDLVVTEVIFQPEDVSNSTNEFMENLFMGIILVMLVVFIGMGSRNAIVVSATIPLSILITFICMKLFGIKIHQMSLTALMISLGILVDNAIVVSDAIQVKIDEGKELKEAALEATMESSVPIFIATLTTIAAFSPLLGLPGTAGSFLKAIPIVLIIAIIAAYVVAMFITPALAVVFFKKNKNLNKKEGKLKKSFEKGLKTALKMKKTVLLATFIIFILVIKIVMPLLPSQFFPYVDKDLFYVEIVNEKSGDMESTEELVDKVGDLLIKRNEITEYSSAVGNGLPKFYITVPPATPSMDYGQIVCKYDLSDTDYENRLEFVEDVQKMLDEEIAGGKCKVNPLQNAEPGAKIVIRVSGENLDRIAEVSKEIKSELSNMEGTINVSSDIKDKTIELKVDVDEDKALNLGITKYDIQRQINIALYGSIPSIYRKDGMEFKIKLKADIEDVATLENMKIKSSMTGKKIPLKQFAEITYNKKVDTVKRYKNKKTVEIISDTLDGYSPVEITNKIESVIENDLNTEGTIISYAGERKSISENFGVLGVLAIAAIFLIYVILIVQFNSFVQPLVILMTIPLSLIGSVLGLFIFRSPLSLTAFLGIIALIGLVVKNGILLIEYINIARRSGMNLEDACIDAVDKRFNPIILSAVTTILGLFPLAISGSSLFSPMAIALMSGLTISTFLTMIIIPVIYSTIEQKLQKKKL